MFYFIVFLFCPDLKMADIWKDIASFKDPEFARLAEGLSHTVMKARADTTTRKYLQAYGRWKRWIQPARSFPVEVPKFLLYLQDLGEKSSSSSAVLEAINAVSWVQRLAGVETVGRNQLVRAVSDGFKRTLARPTKKKEPITKEMLGRWVASLGQPLSLTDVRLASIALLAFAAFLRADEILKIRCRDVRFTPHGMDITIASSKTDQLRQGQIVPVASSGNPTCPVAMLRSYVAVGSIDLASDLPLFRGISSVSGKEKLRPSGGLSYTRLRELVLKKIRELGYDEKIFGLHSFRAGGATLAANNPTLPDRLFKRHGRWRSENAKDGYIKESLQNRLAVSKGLGL